MKALNSLQSLSNRLEYATICVLKYSRDCKPRRVCESERVRMNEKRINAAPPYLSLDVLKSRHSHVPHFEPWIWIEAKKWLSFAFISWRVLFFVASFKFTIFPLLLLLSQFGCAKFGVGFAHIQSSEFATIFGILEYIVVDVCPT